MTNVTTLRADGEVEKLARESACRLAERFGVTQAELHAAIKPLFLLMHEHGIESLAINRDGTKALVTVDGKPM
ncbi:MULTISPECIES: hypothetical protein [unclassified Burkholderia]|uniref:hypothetical protein n=1 Tax=unclassified Burkholderia TaxID=2613784 RepID=UPI002AB1D49A|nr:MULTISPECIES: hypothetical protein [unclassified Burkholderia]